MPNNGVQLIKADTSNVPVIAELAHVIWKQHYPSIISLEQVNYMLDLMYSRESLIGQMTEKGHDFYLIQQNNQIIGFISVSKIQDTDDGFFLHKFYLDQDLSRKGAGTSAHLELIRLLKPSLIRLTVNRQNYKSINFYFKNGFKIEGIADFDIGNGYMMNDFVMVWAPPDSAKTKSGSL